MRTHTLAATLLATVAAGCGGARRTDVPQVAPAPVAIVVPDADPGDLAVVAPDAGVPVPQRVAGGLITATVLPAPAYVEVADHARLVNCDLVLDNGTGVAWTLVELQVTVRDRAGATVWRKFLSGNGVSPSITTIPDRELAAGERQLVLNPLYEFPLELDLGVLEFALTFAHGDEQLVATTSVAPTAYRNHVRLQLPLHGRLIVWDGHDFLSHHRRWDYVFEPIRALGFDSNPARYAYDLVTVDADGAMYAGDPAQDASWFSFGQPVFAPAAGTVRVVVDGQPDDHQFDMGALKDDLMVQYGNRIVLDHGHGELSVLAHLRQGSAKVKVGDQVAAGAELAAIGASGSALFPHLHYQLQSTADGHAEGLPSYFHGFARVRGQGAPVTVKVGAIDSGDIVVSPAPKRGRGKAR